MNEEIKKNEISAEELEKINGGMDLGILPGLKTVEREQQNKETKKNAMEMNDDALKSIAFGNGVPAILNPFEANKG